MPADNEVDTFKTINLENYNFEKWLENYHLTLISDVKTIGVFYSVIAVFFYSSDPISIKNEEHLN